MESLGWSWLKRAEERGSVERRLSWVCRTFSSAQYLPFMLIFSALAALAELEKNIESQNTQIDTLEQTLFELRGDIAAGTHVPPGVRVLSLKENPAQEWSDLRQAVMDRLKGENEALLMRLRELEDARATGDSSSGNGSKAGPGRLDGDLVPRESWEVVRKEKVELEEVVKQKEKRLLRLQQVCTPLWCITPFDTMILKTTT